MKPLQPHDTVHPDNEDSCSVTSSYPFSTFISYLPLDSFVLVFLEPFHSTAASVRTLKGKTTVAAAPTFRCSDRAEKRKEVPSLSV